MSIYSGFATRNQEHFYDKIIYSLISTLLVRVSKFYKNQEVDQSAFKRILKEQHRALNKLQKRKYLQPKYAELLEHFIKKFNNQHQEFQQRRRSIQAANQFNRTLSALDQQILQFKNFTDKIDTIDFQQLNNDKQHLLKIQEKKLTHNKSSKKRKKSKNHSIKSNLDLWEVRKQKLPQIPSMQPLEQTLMGRTRFNNFSQKIRNKQIDEDSDGGNSFKKVLNKPPKFRAKMFFK